VEKKTHEKKNTIIANKDLYIGYLGPTVEGSRHDYRMFKEEFPPKLNNREIHPFILYKILVDLGYLGIEKDYAKCIDNIIIPDKKPRKSKKNPNPELTSKQKKENREKSQIRVRVENAICGSKRLGIVSQVFRNKSLEFNDLVMEISCSLWNFHLSF